MQQLPCGRTQLSKTSTRGESYPTTAKALLSLLWPVSYLFSVLLLWLLLFNSPTWWLKLSTSGLLFTSWSITKPEGLYLLSEVFWMLCLNKALMGSCVLALPSFHLPTSLPQNTHTFIHSWYGIHSGVGYNKTSLNIFHPLHPISSSSISIPAVHTDWDLQWLTCIEITSALYTSVLHSSPIQIIKIQRKCIDIWLTQDFTRNMYHYLSALTVTHRLLSTKYFCPSQNDHVPGSGDLKSSFPQILWHAKIICLCEEEK